MKSFEQTRDPIELIFKHRILRRFPNYGVFWEKFIGYRDDKLPNPFPYGLNFPENYDSDKKELIENRYKKINMVCHHLFCSLAIAEEALDNYLKNLPRKPTPNAYFESFSSVNIFYLNLGVCRDMVNQLIVEIIRGPLEIDLAVDECEKCGNPKPGYLDAFAPYLEKENPELASNFKNWKSRINKIRTRLSHLGKMGIVVKKDGEYMPKDLPKKAEWANDHNEVINKGNAILVNEAMEKDLEGTETTINLLFDIFINKLTLFFERERISVNYGN